MYNLLFILHFYLVSVAGFENVFTRILVFVIQGVDVKILIRVQCFDAELFHRIRRKTLALDLQLIKKSSSDSIVEFNIAVSLAFRGRKFDSLCSLFLIAIFIFCLEICIFDISSLVVY